MVLINWVKQTIFIISEIIESARSCLEIKEFRSDDFSTPNFKFGTHFSVLRIVYLCAIITWLKGYEAISYIEEAFTTNKYVFFCEVAFLGAYQNSRVIEIYQRIVLETRVQSEDYNKDD